MTRSARLIGGVFVIAGVASPATAATLYVNGTCGNDAWSGLSPDCQGPDGPVQSIALAISMSSDGDEVVVADGVYGGGLGFNGKHVTLRSANGPDNCTIDGTAFPFWGGTETTDTVVQGFTMTNGTGMPGGAVYMQDAGGSFIDCVFTGNTSDRGGALFHIGTGDLILSGCRFTGNSADIAIGAVFRRGDGAMIVSDCIFTDNDGGDGPALACGTASTQVVNCLFAGNTAQFLSAALVVANEVHDVNTGAVTNCVFSRNSAQRGAVYVGANIDFSNCSFSGNLTGSGLMYSRAYDFITVRNSVFWGNTPEQITHDPAYGGSQLTVSFSNVGGGWSGPGNDNIDADPLFVQAGTDDLRLAVGSPCIDAASNDLIAADVLDLDGDGNTAEPVPFDLAGHTRVQSGIVDMGAYEGVFDADNPAAGATDLDAGQFAILVPVGGPFNPLLNPAVIVTNTSQQDDATFLVTQIDGELHPGAGGFSDLGSILQTETTLADGQFTANLFIPFSFEAGDIKAGIAAQGVTPTWYDPATGDWALAVSGNTGPQGEWIYSEDPANWGNTTQVGDWGVFWNPDTLQGLAWANVDHSSDFGIGLSLECVGDCGPGADGEIGIDDLLALLAAWGPVTPGGPCDVNGDGVIDEDDFIAMLESWGPCVESSMPQGTGDPRVAEGVVALAPVMAARSADLDGDGRVGRGDLDVLKASWGRGAGTREWFDILAQWND